MTAPYNRVGVDRTLGDHRRRVKKLEGMDMLATEISWNDYDPLTGISVYCDTGADPDPFGYLFSGIGILIQETAVTCWLTMSALGGWIDGGGAQYLIPFNPAYPPNGAVVDASASPVNIPLGVAYAYDFSGASYTEIFLRGSAVSLDPSLAYLEGVLIDGSKWGPGNPYTWAAGDLILGGAFTYFMEPPENA